METQDKQDKLKQKIKTAQETADEYLRQIEKGEVQQDALAPEVVETLQNTLEELHVAEEELRVQKEELEGTQLIIEAERARYLELFEFAPDGYLVTDPQGVIEEANQAASDLLGIRADHLVGKPLANYVCEADRKEFRRQLNHLSEIGQLRDWDFNLQPRDGGQFSVAATVTVTSDGTDEVSRLRWMLRDITERVRAEEALRESKERYQSLFNSIRDAILVADAERNIINCNPAFVDLFGYSFEEIKGKKTVSVYENQEQFEALGQKIAEHRGERSFLYTVKYQKKSGEVFSGETNVFYLKDREGEIVGFIGLIRDISERLQAEEALRESEEKYRTLVNSTLQGVVIAQSDPIRLVFANPAMTKISGYTPEKLIGMEPDELVKLIFEEDRERFFSNFQKRVQGESIPQENEYRLETKDGTIKWIALYSSRIEYQNEPATLTTFMDITKRKRAEETLQEYSERLEELVAERTRELRDAQEKLIRQERLAALGQIAGSIGHELRNPLGVINNANYYLGMKLAEADEDVKESLDLIDQETQNASKIIADLLDFGRAQEADSALVNVSEVINAVIGQNPPPDNVTLSVDVPDNLPPIFVDELQIKQVLTNLVTNAYQAMSSSSSDGAPEGGELSVNSEQYTDNSIQITVQDTGTGIPPENLEKIFEPLYTTKARGIGLGLAICKKLVEANGGRIEVESEVNDGTTFRVFLPVAKETD